MGGWVVGANELFKLQRGKAKQARLTMPDRTNPGRGGGGK